MSVQYKQVGGSTYTSGGPFHFSKTERAVKSLFGGVVLTFGDLVASELIRFKVYGSIMPVKSDQ